MVRGKIRVAYIKPFPFSLHALMFSQKLFLLFATTLLASSAYVSADGLQPISSEDVDTKDPMEIANYLKYDAASPYFVSAYRYYCVYPNGRSVSSPRPQDLPC